MASVSPADGSAMGILTAKMVLMKAQNSAVSVTCSRLEPFQAVLCPTAPSVVESNTWCFV